MKKTLFIVLLVVSAINISYAQHYFNTRTPLHSFATVITSVIPQNNMYYCTSIAWDSINNIPNSNLAYNIWGVNFSIFDSLGNVVKDTIYQLTGLRNLYPWNNSLYPMPDKGFLLAASDDVDTFGAFYCLLIRYDSVGNMLWTKEFDKPFCTDTVSSPLWVIMDMKPTGTGEWLVLSDLACAYNGPYGPTNKVSFVLTKLDSSFNIEWNKEYSEPSLNALPNRLLVTTEGYLMGGGVDNELYIGQPGSLINRAEMIMMDTAGNQQWIWQSNANEEIGGISDVLQTYDGGWVYCSIIGYTISAGGGDSEIEAKGWIEKLDASRNHVWNHILGTGFAIGSDDNQVILKQLPDSSIVLGGEVIGGFNGEGDTLMGYGSLSKFKADGSVVWERKYQAIQNNPTIDYTIYDMKQTPDGGFVLAGQATGGIPPFIYPSQQGWLIKVDSNGCAGPDDPQCWPVITPQPPKGGVIMVYPNPARGEVTIKTPPGLPIAIGTGVGEVTVLDMVGRVMIQQALVNGSTTISLNGLAPGVYLYEVKSDGIMIGKGKLVKE